MEEWVVGSEMDFSDPFFAPGGAFAPVRVTTLEIGSWMIVLV